MPIQLRERLSAMETRHIRQRRADESPTNRGFFAGPPHRVGCCKLGGGPGRTRTCNQAVMSTLNLSESQAKSITYDLVRARL